MIDTQLIIVEGVMGSGKSTTSQRIAKRLRQELIPTRHVPESFREHPTNVTRTLTYWHKIWIEETPASFIAKSQALWQNFVAQARTTSQTFVFDGQFFHGDLTGLLIANTERSQLIDYVDSLVEIVQPLRPTLIYLYQTNLAESLTRTATMRGSSWLRGQVGWKVDSPYCAQRGYQGPAGWLKLYADYRQLTDDLFARLPIAKLAIENSAGDWQKYEAQLFEFLELHTLGSAKQNNAEE